MSPVDRGKPGSKIHVLSDAAGLPLVTGISAANTHDSQAVRPLFMAIRAIRAPAPSSASNWNLNSADAEKSTYQSSWRRSFFMRETHD